MQTLSQIAADWARVYLIHMLEFSAFVLLLWAIDKTLRLPVTTRYGLWLLALAKLFVPPVFRLPLPAGNSAVGQFLAPTQIIAPGAAGSAAISWPAVFFIAWLATLLVIAGLIIRHNFKLRRRLRGAQPIRSSELSLAQVAQYSTPLRLLESDRIEAPVLIGFLPPRLYLPANFRTWPREQQRSVLAHELAHVRSGDLWLLLAQNLALVLFAWNPLVWFLHRRLSHLRELRCDAVAIQHTGADPVAYGKFLLTMLENQKQPRAALMTGTYFAESKTTLKQRFQHLLTQTGGQTPMKRLWHSALVAIMALALIPFSWQCSQDDGTQKNPLADEKLATTAEEKFVPYDDPPQPVGGFAAIAKALHYPEIARKAGIEGRVLLKVVVTEDGTVEHVEVIEEPEQKRAGLSEAAIEAVKSVEWLPAKSKGNPVKVTISLPVIFSLNSAKSAPGLKTVSEKAPPPPSPPPAQQ